MSFVEPVKIAVVGAGNVGGSFAYAALLRGLASDLVLIDGFVASQTGLMAVTYISLFQV